MESYVTHPSQLIPQADYGILNATSETFHAFNGNDTFGHWCLANTNVSGNLSAAAIPVLEEIKYLIKAYVNPGVCLFGIVGNMFNLIVLTRRRLQCTMDCTMERAAHLGLITLAVSDMLYCLLTLLTAFTSRSQVLFHNILIVYIKMYTVCFQQIFVHTSIWLTVIMAVGRYAAICRPIQARYLVGVNATRIAIVMTFIVWTLVEIPRFWTYHLYSTLCTDEHGEKQWEHLIMQGPFVLNKKMRTAFDFISSIFGFCVPISILAYCNIHLIKALRESSRVRQLFRVHPRSTTHGSRITPTLVAIVCMFIFFNSPSEILNLYFFFIEGAKVEAFNFAIVVTNLLQSLNFSCNFVLYCLVNVHFRETWKDLMYCKACRRPYSRVDRRGLPTSAVHNNLTTKGSFIVQSSFETVI